MNTTTVQSPFDRHRLARRNEDRLRQAVARRRIQELRDAKLLQTWLSEVWDESISLTDFDSSMQSHSLVKFFNVE